jgi:hypothetical protein
MGTALVTGPATAQARVIAALRAAGLDAVDHVPEGGTGFEPVVDCYVRLTGPASATSGRADLLSIVDDVSALAGRLSARALVVLVASDWDWRERSALRLLTEAALVNGPAAQATVVVLDSAGDVASTVAPNPVGRTTGASLADIGGDRAYADWREDVLSMAEEPERTYFGWLGSDARASVAVLAGSVMSPLAGWGDSRAALCWRDHGETLRLAQALLIDALGPAECLCPDCRGLAADCGACEGSGMAAGVRPLALSFSAEVVGRLPQDGFELRVGDVVDWARSQTPALTSPDVVRRSRGRAPLTARRLSPTPV